MSYTYKPPQEPITVLHQDGDLLFAVKPAGLLSVPGRLLEHQDSMQTRLEKMDPSVRLVHRLDMDTSGIMVFARNKEAQIHLSQQFEQRLSEKTYIALIEGKPDKTHGRITLKSKTDWHNRPVQMIAEDGREGITDWQVLERMGDHSRVALTPLTGRTHQLRLAMQHLGHPILGDRWYAPQKVICKSDRLCLHAQTLSIVPPNSVAPITLTSEAPF